MRQPFLSLHTNAPVRIVTEETYASGENVRKKEKESAMLRMEGYGAKLKRRVSAEEWTHEAHKLRHPHVSVGFLPNIVFLCGI